MQRWGQRLGAGIVGEGTEVKPEASAFASSDILSLSPIQLMKHFLLVLNSP